jgi:glycogen debranching enzyme
VTEAPWTFAGEAARAGAPQGVVTLVEGSSFALSDDAGDITAGLPHGVFFLDTRFVSRFELRIDDQPLEPLGVSVDDPFAAVFFGRARRHEGQGESGVVVFRRRWVGRGLREDIEVQNHDRATRQVCVELRVGSDFANLFAVKEGRVRHRGAYSSEITADSIGFGHRLGERTRAVDFAFSEPADVSADSASWLIDLEPHASWRLCVGIAGSVDGSPIEPRYRCGEPIEVSKPARRLAEWRQRAPVVASDRSALVEAVARSVEDLGALRIFDPAFPDLPVVAAGAPWFMTLFGRDSVLTSWMALTVDPDLAKGVVETLARFQGSRVDPETEEEPGKILHEVRLADSGSLSLGDGSIYYGSVDATPLFVMLLGELRRWGLADDVVERLLPHVDRALQWIADYGDRDGDGYVEYQRATERGLANQGWKDSWDGIRFADGTVAEPPIALCEVQGYVYASYICRVHFAREQGDTATADRYRQRAADLKERFNRDFWLADRGWFAVGLDRHKRPIDALASNMGHCLWTGIVDEDKAAAVARHLVDGDLFSGWGVRTLAQSSGGFNPVSYHCGSVWPHDTALAVAGLMRYGFVAEAHKIVEALLDVAAVLGGRLPELFAGVSRHELAVPAAYPTSCVPQAWAAATPLLLVRSLLRLEPWLPQGRIWVAPALPPSMARLRVSGVPLAGSRVTIDVTDGKLTVDGLPSGIELVPAPRDPLTGT